MSEDDQDVTQQDDPQADPHHGDQAVGDEEPGDDDLQEETGGQHGKGGGPDPARNVGG